MRFHTVTARYGGRVEVEPNEPVKEVGSDFAVSETAAQDDKELGIIFQFGLYETPEG